MVNIVQNSPHFHISSVSLVNICLGSIVCVIAFIIAETEPCGTYDTHCSRSVHKGIEGIIAAYGIDGMPCHVDLVILLYTCVFLRNIYLWIRLRLSLYIFQMLLFYISYKSIFCLYLIPVFHLLKDDYCLVLIHFSEIFALHSAEMSYRTVL